MAKNQVPQEQAATPVPQEQAAAINQLDAIAAMLQQVMQAQQAQAQELVALKQQQAAPAPIANNAPIVDYATAAIQSTIRLVKDYQAEYSKSKTTLPIEARECLKEYYISSCPDTITVIIGDDKILLRKNKAANAKTSSVGWYGNGKHTVNGVLGVQIGINATVIGSGIRD